MGEYTNNCSVGLKNEQKEKNMKFNENICGGSVWILVVSALNLSLFH